MISVGYSSTSVGWETLPKKIVKLLLIKILAFIGAYLLYLYGKSLKVTFVNEKKGDQPFLCAHWHQDIIPLVLIGYIRKLKICTMASLSSDGEMITHFLNRLRFKVVRGSQAKRGMEALEEMATWIQKGYYGVLAVDGSRGPKYIVKKGIVKLAQNTGLPIIGVAGSFKWKYSFSSWDQMVIPYPFSKGVIFCSDPMDIPKQCTDEALESKRLEVENALRALKTKAEAYFRLP